MITDRHFQTLTTILPVDYSSWILTCVDSAGRIRPWENLRRVDSIIRWHRPWSPHWWRSYELAPLRISICNISINCALSQRCSMISTFIKFDVVCPFQFNFNCEFIRRISWILYFLSTSHSVEFCCRTRQLEFYEETIKAIMANVNNSNVDIFPYLAAVLIGRVRNNETVAVSEHISYVVFLFFLKGVEWNLCGNRKLSQE